MTRTHARLLGPCFKTGLEGIQIFNALQMERAQIGKPIACVCACGPFRIRRLNIVERRTNWPVDTLRAEDEHDQRY